MYGAHLHGLPLALVCAKSGLREEPLLELAKHSELQPCYGYGFSGWSGLAVVLYLSLQ